jgi:hypothetical protein
MTNRDRMVIMVVAALGVLAAVWFLAVAPKREQAAELASQVSSAQAQLVSAESKVAAASSAQAQYKAAYASIVRLGKAVPASEEVPSLIYQLEVATSRKNVEFASIANGAGSGSSSGSSTSSGSSAATSAAATASFSQMPFTFVFNGSFTDLYHVFQQLNRFTLHDAAGGLEVSGRLLTIQSVSLAPTSPTGSSAASGKGGSEQLSGSITATAYVLPAGQSLTGGATATGPAGDAQTTSATGSSGSPTTPALVQPTP